MLVNKDQFSLDNLIKNTLKKKYIDDGYYLEDGEPIKCYNCESEELEEIEECYDYSLLLEYGVKCSKCNKELGYFAYGNWTMYI